MADLVVSAPTGEIARPLSQALSDELARLRGEIPEGKQGQASVGVSMTGVALGAAWRPKSNLTFTGYAGRLWGGSWQAAASGTLTW